MSYLNCVCTVIEQSTVLSYSVCVCVCVHVRDASACPCVCGVEYDSGWLPKDKFSSIRTSLLQVPQSLSRAAHWIPYGFLAIIRMY